VFECAPKTKRWEFGFYSSYLSSLLYHFSVRFSPSSQRKVVGFANWRSHQLIHADIKCYLERSTSCGTTVGFLMLRHDWSRRSASSNPSARLRTILQEEKNATHESTDLADSQRPTNICQSNVQQPRNPENRSRTCQAARMSN